MTTDQKQAVMVLMNLYHDSHIDEEQYFLLLDFVVSGERGESRSVGDTCITVSGGSKTMDDPWGDPVNGKEDMQ